MRLVIQRVSSGKVKVKRKTVGKIDGGLLVLLGVGRNDSKKDAEILAGKLLKMRIMADVYGKMNLSILDTKSSLLVISQFTLYADTSGGNRPSFVKAGDSDAAKKIYEHFITFLKNKDIDVQSGLFGEYMKIDAALDGPVTIIIDSEDTK